jgi:hypothetical protein
MLPGQRRDQLVRRRHHLPQNRFLAFCSIAVSLPAVYSAPSTIPINQMTRQLSGHRGEQSSYTVAPHQIDNCRANARPTKSPPLRCAAISARTSALTTVSSKPAAPAAAIIAAYASSTSLLVIS